MSASLSPAERPGRAHRPVVVGVIAVAVIVGPVIAIRVVMPGPIVPVMGANRAVAVPPATGLGLARPEQAGRADDVVSRLSDADQGPFGG